MGENAESHLAGSSNYSYVDADMLSEILQP